MALGVKKEASPRLTAVPDVLQDLTEVRLPGTQASTGVTFMRKVKFLLQKGAIMKGIHLI